MSLLLWKAQSQLRVPFVNIMNCDTVAGRRGLAVPHRRMKDRPLKSVWPPNCMETLSTASMGRESQGAGDGKRLPPILLAYDFRPFDPMTLTVAHFLRRGATSAFPADLDFTAGSISRMASSSFSSATRSARGRASCRSFCRPARAGNRSSPCGNRGPAGLPRSSTAAICGRRRDT